MFPKIIIATGCSYGILGYAFQEILDKNKSKFSEVELIINLNTNSMGSLFQTLSIIECVDKLVKYGVNTSDIYILGEFSQIERRDIIIANEFLVNEIDSTKIIDTDKTIERCDFMYYPYCYNRYNSDKINKLIEKITIKKIRAACFPKFENYYVVNTENPSLIDFPNKYLQRIFKNYLNNKIVNIEGIEINISSIEIINRALSYFQNIMFIQEYLKLKNIKYKFCLMQNQFSLYNNLSFRQDELKTINLNGEHYLNQDYVNSNQIWDISTPIKIIKNLINWDNWWFYTNADKNIIWGGIDEYAIDNFGVKGYNTVNNSGPGLFHQHPISFVYEKLIKEELMREYFYD